MPGRLIDITMPLSASTPVWPTNPPVALEPVGVTPAGVRSIATMLHVSNHAGTHLDAPAHLFPAEGATVERLDPEVFLGSTEVFEWKESRDVEPRDLPDLDLRAAPRLLLKTSTSAGFARGEVKKDFPTLTAEAAESLAARGLKLFGIDALSADRPKTGNPVHRALLGSGVVIVEGLVLDTVAPGRWELICLPLRLDGLDGAPARVFLRETGA